MISIEQVFSAIVMVIIAGVVFGLLWWLVDYCSIPEPFNKVARVALAIGAVLICIALLLGLAGHPVMRW